MASHGSALVRISNRISIILENTLSTLRGVIHLANFDVRDAVTGRELTSSRAVLISIRGIKLVRSSFNLKTRYSLMRVELYSSRALLTQFRSVSEASIFIR